VNFAVPCLAPGEYLLNFKARYSSFHARSRYEAIIRCLSNLFVFLFGSSNGIQEIRNFNRFYTNIIGVVDRHIHHGPYSLTEARVLFEISHNPDSTARKIKNTLQVDEGYLSRTIDKLIKLGLITRKKSQGDGRVLILSLSPKGESELRKINEEADASVESMIEHLSPEEVNEILANMRRIQELLVWK
jgi:DNA-binding MarR family transcriptional regulator